ncbi:MAG: hypothetical protein IJT08_03090, partial [Alphaproteobacteria bacterium]|nr:hypothetical protein [Alphaproteobacteria bacterium]
KKIGKFKRGVKVTIYFIVDKAGIQIRVFVIKSQRADCPEVANLINRPNYFQQTKLFTNRGYDISEVTNYTLHKNAM